MDLKEVSEFLAKTDRMIITTHETPDGDGLGAEYALCSVLLEMGKTVKIINSDPAIGKYHFMDEQGLFKTLGIDADLPDNLSDWSLIVLDTDPSNIGIIGEKVVNVCRQIVVVDHHTPSEDSNFDGWLVPDSSSTCEMVFRIIENIHVGFKRDVAVALYTGIVYDTGSFIYPKTQARTFSIANTLVSSGVVPNDVFTRLFENKSTGALILQSLVTSTLVLHEDERVAIQLMPQDTLIASRASYEEGQEIVNIPLQSSKVRVSVFLKEDENGNRRCSMRSKGEVDCAAISRQFGGGGHSTAAGFRFKESFTAVQEKLLESIRSALG